MKVSAYAAHPDPATAVACFIATVLGLNGPFYPVYVIVLVGWADGHLALLSMLASPLFMMIPLLARRVSVIGPVALWLVGTVNTVWCMKLLGPDSGVGVFLLPCIAVAVLLPSGWTRLMGAGLPLLPLLSLRSWFGVPIMTLTGEQDAHLALLNQFSAACLTGLLTLRLARLLPSASGNA